MAQSSLNTEIIWGGESGDTMTKKIKEYRMQHSWGGDDLGTVYCRFTNVSLVDAINYMIKHGPEEYEIAEIEQKREYNILGVGFGDYIIYIYMEDPVKLAALKGSMHYHLSRNPSKNK